MGNSWGSNPPTAEEKSLIFFLALTMLTSDIWWEFRGRHFNPAYGNDVKVKGQNQTNIIRHSTLHLHVCHWFSDFATCTLYMAPPHLLLHSLTPHSKLPKITGFALKTTSCTTYLRIVPKIKIRNKKTVVFNADAGLC